MRKEHAWSRLIARVGRAHTHGRQRSRDKTSRARRDLQLPHARVCPVLCDALGHAEPRGAPPRAAASPSPSTPPLPLRRPIGLASVGRLDSWVSSQRLFPRTRTQDIVSSGKGDGTTPSKGIATRRAKSLGSSWRKIGTSERTPRGRASAECYEKQPPQCRFEEGTAACGGRIDDCETHRLATLATLSSQPPSAPELEEAADRRMGEGSRDPVSHANKHGHASAMSRSFRNANGCDHSM